MYLNELVAHSRLELLVCYGNNLAIRSSSIYKPSGKDIPQQRMIKHFSEKIKSPLSAPKRLKSNLHTYTPKLLKKATSAILAPPQAISEQIYAPKRKEP